MEIENENRTESDGTQGTQNVKKAVGWGALVTLIVTILISILSQIDGEAVGKKINSRLLADASVTAPAIAPEASDGGTPPPSIDVWGNALSDRLEALEKLFHTSGVFADDVDALNRLRGEVSAIRTLVSELEAIVKALNEKVAIDKKRYDKNRKEDILKDSEILDAVRKINRRLSFLEGKIDTLLKRKAK